MHSYSFIHSTNVSCEPTALEEHVLGSWEAVTMVLTTEAIMTSGWQECDQRIKHFSGSKLFVDEEITHSGMKQFPFRLHDPLVVMYSRCAAGAGDLDLVITIFFFFSHE
jgi:hypothetical protein